MELTGNTRYRQSFFGRKLILQVEIDGKVARNAGASVDVEYEVHWIDARVEHLSVVNPAIVQHERKEL